MAVQLLRTHLTQQPAASGSVLRPATVQLTLDHLHLIEKIPVPAGECVCRLSV